MSIATTALRVAAGQAAAAPGDLDANLRTTARLAALAGDQGVRVLVLPEAFLTGYDAAVFAGSLPGRADLTGPRLDPVREQVLRTGVTVVVGKIRQTQEIVAGGRYLSGDQPLRMFAMGTGTANRSMNASPCAPTSARR